MAASPALKVYDASGRYQAACHEYEAAAAVVSFYGEGATVRLGHGRDGVLWREGANHDGIACESYDGASATMSNRVLEFVSRRNRARLGVQP